MEFAKISWNYESNNAPGSERAQVGKQASGEQKLPNL